MLIKKVPVAKIKIKEDGSFEIIHFTDGIEKPCIYCGELTTERRLGLSECSSCKEYGYSKCKQCKYGVEKSTFCCNGNDFEDHFEYYTGCAKRDHYNKLRKVPDFKSCPSAWGVSPLNRKKCFSKKEE